MSRDQALRDRSESKCELCRSTESLTALPVPPRPGDTAEECVLVCAPCQSQIDGSEPITPDHWRGLNDSMWSEVPAVQIVAYRMLHRLEAEPWARELLEMLYLEDETLEWAKDGLGDPVSEVATQHVDSNGVTLETGDTVTLIKDLEVKGANFTAKRGTAVRGIVLVADNPEHIEGKVSGQRIVILTKFVKKSG